MLYAICTTGLTILGLVGPLFAASTNFPLLEPLGYFTLLLHFYLLPLVALVSDATIITPSAVRIQIGRAELRTHQH